MPEDGGLKRTEINPPFSFGWRAGPSGTIQARTDPMPIQDESAIAGLIAALVTPCAI
tara:strand:- start:580 stop:750 length:171 start_codon:yes stop_codon:yes gene_type:complete